MSLVEVDPRFRVTIPKAVRTKLNVTEGQRLYVVSFGDSLIMRPVPERPAVKLDEILGDLRFDREARKKAERWLFRRSRERR